MNMSKPLCCVCICDSGRIKKRHLTPRNGLKVTHSLQQLPRVASFSTTESFERLHDHRRNSHTMFIFYCFSVIENTRVLRQRNHNLLSKQHKLCKKLKGVYRPFHNCKCSHGFAYVHIAVFIWGPQSLVFNGQLVPRWRHHGALMFPEKVCSRCPTVQSGAENYSSALETRPSPAGTGTSTLSKDTPLHTVVAFVQN